MIIRRSHAWYWPAAALAMAAIAIIHAQEEPAQPKYTYEVVSIKRAPPGEMNSGFSPGPQGGMVARNVTVVQALTFAYNVQDYQIVNAPGWTQTERFYITFTPDRSEIALDQNTSNAAREGWGSRQGQRLQAVLRDRFGLAVRQETRDVPIYALTVAKAGHKLSAPAHPDRGQTLNINRGQQIVGTTAKLKSLAQALSMILGHPVRDETGLDGDFDFKVDWAPDSTKLTSNPAGPDEPAMAADAGRASLFTALAEQLGLRLDSKKGPAPVLVIEKVERPSEN